VDITSWLFNDIIISRSFQTQLFYIFMFFFAIFSLWLSRKARLFRFSLLLWLAAGLIGVIWEIVLFSSGLRQYSFIAGFELFYHALTEGGPGLIVMVVFADKIGLIDLSEYKEEVRKRHS